MSAGVVVAALVSASMVGMLVGLALAVLAERLEPAGQHAGEPSLRDRDTARRYHSLSREERRVWRLQERSEDGSWSVERERPVGRGAPVAA